MEEAPPNVDLRYNRAFAAACALAEQQMRAAVEIVARAKLGGQGVEQGLVGAVTMAMATNFAALNNAKAA